MIAKYAEAIQAGRKALALLGVELPETELETMEYTREEYLGKPLFEIIHPDYLGITKEAFASVSKGEKFKAYQTALLTKSGQNIDVEASFALHWRSPPSRLRARRTYFGCLRGWGGSGSGRVRILD